MPLRAAAAPVKADIFLCEIYCINYVHDVVQKDSFEANFGRVVGWNGAAEGHREQPGPGGASVSVRDGKPSPGSPSTERLLTDAQSLCGAGRVHV